MSNLAKYNDVFKSVFNVGDEALHSSFDQNSVGNWDSVTHLTLVSTLEEEFNVMFDVDDILQLTSYEEGKKIMAKLDIAV